MQFVAYSDKIVCRSNKLYFCNWGMNMKKLIYILLIIAILAGISFTMVPSYLSKAANVNVVEVTVPEGASLNRVSNTLFDKGVIKSKTWFRYKAKAAGVDRKIKPGVYSIPSNANLDEIFALLEKGIPDTPVILTIPEGYTLYQIAQRVEELGFGTKDEFLESTKKYFQSGEYSFDTEELFFELEGYLYPDTYHFTDRQTVDDVVNRLTATMEKVFTEEYKNRAKELDLSIHQVLTIASLIEREAQHDGERATVSGVILNRLKKNMILQIDATVIYGVGEGREHKTELYMSDLEKITPFNSYKVAGLPPGPIASPGKESIHAALYPEEHDYLYYVLSEKEDGHVFTKTHDEHLIYVAKYRNRKK